MYKCKIALVFLVIFLLLDKANSQPAGIDTTFNLVDTGLGNGDGLDNANSIAIQSDGKIIIGGGFTFVHGTGRNKIARLNTDGSLDLGFNPGTGANIDVNSVVIQPDGKILIGGWFTSFNGTTVNRIARLNSDGSRDLTFNPGTGANNIISSVVLQSDGKVIVAGQFTSFNGTGRNRIARLNADGSLDTGFNPGTGATANINSVAIQSDGKILIGGAFTSYNGTVRNCIARLNSDGSLDTGFNPGTGTSYAVSPSVNSVAVQSDGKILIGGVFTSYNGTAKNYIARLNTNGTIDGTFSPGTAANTTVSSIVLQTDGKILIGGYFSSYNGNTANRIARLNTDGSIDSGFNTGTGAGLIGSNPQVICIAVQNDGNILIGGNFNAFNEIGRFGIVRIGSDGSVDKSFYPTTGANNSIRSIALQPDGKILIGGKFTLFNTASRNHVARLNADGSLDPTFDPGTGLSGLTFPDVYSIAVQSDGKILVAGLFDSYNGTPRKNIVRLNSDGSLDASFDPGTGPDATIYSMAVQPDGKILVAGQFVSFNGTSRKYLARLNADGSIDTGFNTGSGANNVIWTLLLLNSGKIVIGGDFTSYKGTSINRIAQLNADATMDSNFSPGSGGDGTVLCLAAQSDGKIIAGGSFNIFYNGSPRNCIVRLNANGSLDTGFNPGAGASGGAILSVVIQNNGKIVVAGQFTAYNGIARNLLARLNPDASLDVTFNPGTGIATYNNSPVLQNALVLQDDGKILIGGYFTSYNGTGKNRIARLMGGEAVQITPLSFSSICQGANISIPYTASSGIFNNGNVFTAQLSDMTGSFSSPVTIGTVTATSSGVINATVPANTPPGTAYRVRVTANNPSVTGNDNGVDLVVNQTVSSSVAISANPSTSFCPGSNIIFSATPFNGGANPTYQWYLNGTEVPGETSDSYSTSTLNDGDQVEVSMTSDASCVSTPIVQSSPLIVHSALVQPGQFVEGPTAVTSGTTGVAYTVPNDISVTYNWSYSGTGVVISGNGNSVLLDFSQTATSGNLSVTASNSCGTSPSRTIAISVTGVTSAASPNSSKAFSVGIYPNPIISSSTIRIEVQESLKADVELRSSTGNLIYSFLKDGVLYAGENNFSYPEDLRPGIYIVRIFTSDKTICLKCVKTE